MTRRLATMCFITVLLVAGSSSIAQAQGSDLHAESLKGISAVTVLVEDLSDSAKLLGLTADTLRTDVELKLRLAGMRVMANEEALKLTDVPALYVRVTVLPGGVAAGIDVQLGQNALLRRNGQLVYDATTWERTGVVANATLQFIRDRLKDQVDDFLNAWLSVNPKK
jgi:hypothetical protein